MTQSMPRIDVVERLARVLAVTPGWLAYARPREAPQSEVIAPDRPLRCAGVGERLRAERERAELTRTELGRRTEQKYAATGSREERRLPGLSGTAILGIEEGRSVPSVESVERLADALGLSPAWLAFGEGERAG